MKPWIRMLAFFFAISLIIVFAQDIRTSIDEFLAEHGHGRKVQVQLHGCAMVNGVQYCIDTK